MRKIIAWLVLALVFVGVLIGAGALYKKLSADAVPTVPSGSTETAQETAVETAQETAAETTQTKDKETAPEMTVFDADGNAQTLSSHFGKPLVVNFWATWCGPCSSELPVFDAAAKQYAGKVDFMMVNLTDGYRDTVEGVKAFVEANGYTFPVYFDTQNDAGRAYGVYIIPMTVLIRADGTIMQSYLGVMTEAKLESFLSMLTAQNN